MMGFAAAALKVLRALIAGVFVMAALTSVALASGWSPVALPAHSSLDGISCRSAQWCEAVGAGSPRPQVEHWDGRRWAPAPAPPAPARAMATVLSAVTCASTHACVAVGQSITRDNGPWSPVIERWNGRHWTLERAPRPPLPAGYHGVHGYLRAVACPSAQLCFAVGSQVPLGAGNAPGTPLIERWNGRRWALERTPEPVGPLTAVSCTGSRACTAVGSWNGEVGPDGTSVVDSAVERWDGATWSVQAPPTPASATGAGLFGVDCVSDITCLAVGNAQYEDTYGGFPSSGVDHATGAEWTSGSWATQTLPFPAGVYRGTTQAPRDSLTAVSCASSTACAAVGEYSATNGDLGPLVARWDGAAWVQMTLHRGPVTLAAVSCPSVTWCMAIGPVAERYTG